MTDTKRSRIEQKVAAAERRNSARAEPTLLDRAGERAIEAKDKVAGFARRHPIATIAGGLALGVLVSGLFRGSPTRRIGAKVGSAVGRRATGLAAIGVELALAYGRKAARAAGEARSTGAERLDELGDTVGDAARALRRDAAAAARDAGHTVGKALRGRLN